MKETIDIYSDGACSGNPGPGGAAALIVAFAEEAASSAAGYRRTTNQRMEIAAATLGIRLAAEYARRYAGDFRAVLHTDSQYVVATLTKGWKRRANLDLWNELDRAVAELTAAAGPNTLTVEWVKGHAGNAWNNVADRLAVEASHNATREDGGYAAEQVPDLFSSAAEETAPQTNPTLTAVTSAGRTVGLEYFVADGIRYLIVTNAEGTVLGITRA